MYRGQQGGSSLPISENLGLSPSDSINLSPVQSPLDMEHLTKPQMQFETMAGVTGARRLNNAPAPWGLMSFYANDEQPWNPYKQSAPAAQSGNMVNTVDVRRNPSAFASWRSNGPTSECGTIPQQYLPSDSGYESRAKHSIDGRSVYDENQDTQSLSGHMTDFNPFLSNASGFARDVPTQSWYPATTPVALQNGNADKHIICPNCKAQCKTKSELNKHNQRHRKAHKCDVQGCTRKEGFGTLNDLERHKNSVHPDLATSGPRYRCQIGNCHKKDKIWPRADNFRQHLRRVHQRTLVPDDDLSDFVYQPQKPTTTEALRTVQEDDLEGVGSELFNFGADPWAEELASPEQPMDIDLVLDPSLTNVQGAQNIPLVQTEYVQPEKISRPASVAKSISMVRADFHGARTVQPSATVGLTKALEASRSPQEPSKNSATDDMDCDLSETSTSGNLSTSQEEPSPQESSISIDSLDEQDALKLLEKFPNVFERLIKTRPETTASAAPPQKPLPSATTVTDTRHPCPHHGCIKTFARRCELKKHVKRHDKPYGCTFHGCNKKFGSKNDWKRHENSQHFQLEVWKCDERRAPSSAAVDQGSASSPGICDKVCHRRETFRSHLQREHKMEDSQKVDRALEKCRVGRNGDSRFWCGFCVKIIEVTKKGSNGWTERFNHIDNHYAGRDNAPKRDISEWKAVDPDLAEMGLTGSMDDSSDGESADEPVIPRMSVGSRKRRVGDVDDGERGPKRPKTEARVTLMWVCCNCRISDATVKLNDSCVECCHKRCENCIEQEVTAQ